MMEHRVKLLEASVETIPYCSLGQHPHTDNIVPQMDGYDGIENETLITINIPTLDIQCTIHFKYLYTSVVGKQARDIVIHYIQNNIDNLTKESFTEDLIYFIFN